MPEPIDLKPLPWAPRIISLPFQSYSRLTPCRPEQLITKPVELKDWKDVDYYERHGWEDEIGMPEIAPPLYFHSGVRNPIIPLAGSHWIVQILSDYRYEPYEYEDKTLLLTETKAPCSPHLEGYDPRYGGRAYWTFFGQPAWVQFPCYWNGPDGEPLRHLCSEQVDWGDCGNWIVLVSLDSDGLPNGAWLVAHCC